MKPKNLVKKVSDYLELPTNEDPTVATVKDKEKLQDQALKDAVKNGDKILVYAKSQVIVVYRPSTGKIVLFQPLNLYSQAATSSATDKTKTTDTTTSDTTNPDALTAPAGSDTTTTPAQ